MGSKIFTTIASTSIGPIPFPSSYGVFNLLAVSSKLSVETLLVTALAPYISH